MEAIGVPGVDVLPVFYTRLFYQHPKRTYCTGSVHSLRVTSLQINNFEVGRGWFPPEFTSVSVLTVDTQTHTQTYTHVYTQVHTHTTPQNFSVKGTGGWAVSQIYGWYFRCKEVYDKIRYGKTRVFLKCLLLHL